MMNLFGLEEWKSGCWPGLEGDGGTFGGRAAFTSLSASRKGVACIRSHRPEHPRPDRGRRAGDQDRQRVLGARVTTMDAKSRCRIAAITTPGITPGLGDAEDELRVVLRATLSEGPAELARAANRSPGRPEWWKESFGASGSG
jgi:hypothetical protein